MRNLTTIGLITAAKISSALLAMIAAIIASRVMSVADFGAISLVLSAAVVAAAFIDWGSSIYVRKHSPFFANFCQKRVGSVVAGVVSAMSIKAVSIGLVLAIALLVLFRDAPFGVFIATVPIGLAFAMELLTGEILRARRKYMAAEYYSGGLRQTVYLIVLVFCANFHAEINFIAISYAAAMILATVSSVISFGGARPRLPSVTWPIKAIRISKERGHFIFVGLLNILLNQIPLLFAGLAASQETAGIVRISMLFGLLMQMAISANAMFFAPKISAVARGDGHTMPALVKQSSQFGLIGIPVGIIGVILTPFVISVLFGQPYGSSVLGAQFLIVVYAILSVFGAYGQFVLLRGGERVAMGAAVVAVASQIVLLPTLTYFWPIEGFAAAYGVSMLISYAYLGFFGYRVTGIVPGPIGLRN